MSESFTYTFDDAEIETESLGELYVSIDVEFEAYTTDNGIGPYEFWGSPYVDVRMEYEVQTSEAVLVSYYEGEEEIDREWTFKTIGPLTLSMQQVVNAANSYVEDQHDQLADHANDR